MVVREDNGQTARIGGRMPDGANIDFACHTGYDGAGRTYVHYVIQRDCTVLLTRSEKGAA